MSNGIYSSPLLVAQPTHFCPSGTVHSCSLLPKNTTVPSGFLMVGRSAAFIAVLYGTVSVIVSSSTCIECVRICDAHLA